MPAIEFTTERLTAERLSASHLDELTELHLDSEVARYLGGLRSEEQTQEYLAANLAHWEQHGFGLWAFRAGGRFAGRGGIRHIDIEGTREVEIAYTLRRDLWRRGLGTEIAQALVEMWRSRRASPSLIGIAALENEPARRILVNVGLSHERDGDLPRGAGRALSNLALKVSALGGLRTLPRSRQVGPSAVNGARNGDAYLPHLHCASGRCLHAHAHREGDGTERPKRLSPRPSPAVAEDYVLLGRRHEARDAEALCGDWSASSRCDRYGLPELICAVDLNACYGFWQAPDGRVLKVRTSHIHGWELPWPIDLQDIGAPVGPRHK